MGTVVREDLDDSTVLWIQSSSGIFMDIRVQKSQSIEQFKSFAGTSSFDTEKQWLTWNRELDLRPQGPPDIGRIDFLSDTVIQEDGVSEGDDYREIWENIAISDYSTASPSSGNTSSTSISGISNTGKDTPLCGFCVRLSSTSDGRRDGYFMAEGGWFGVVFSREEVEEGERDKDALLSRFYCSDARPQMTPAEIKEATKTADSFTSAVGLCVDWTVQHSVNTELIGTCLLNGNGELEMEGGELRGGEGESSLLGRLLESAHLELISGELPRELERFMAQ